MGGLVGGNDGGLVGGCVGSAVGVLVSGADVVDTDGLGDVGAGLGGAQPMNRSNLCLTNAHSGDESAFCNFGCLARQLHVEDLNFEQSEFKRSASVAMHLL